MGIFDFLRGSGKKVTEGNEEVEILNNILTALSGEASDGSLQGLQVHFDDGVATLTGVADSEATRQKAILLAGNIKGVVQVNDDNLMVNKAIAAIREEDEHVELPRAEIKQMEPEYTFYTIQSGDSLSKIAKRVYGDAMKWPDLFEANREVIQDPNLIYPGQQIRVPKQ